MHIEKTCRPAVGESLAVCFAYGLFAISFAQTIIKIRAFSLMQKKGANLS